MGKSKETVVTQSSQQQTPQPTAEEVELNKLQLEQAKAFDPIQRELNTNAGNLINMLLTGRSDLPGFLKNLSGGIDPSVTQGLVDESLRDVNAQLRKSGAGTFLESGVAQSIGARTAGDIRRASEEFNIGNKFNLLNLATGGQAQVQQPALSTANMLSQRLAGLRPVTTTGTGSQVKNTPFLNTAFAGGLGQGLGSSSFYF